MNYLRGQGDMLVQLAIVVLEFMPEHGAPRQPLYAALVNHTHVDGFNSILRTLDILGAIVNGDPVILRGPRYDLVLSDLKKSSNPA